MSDKSERRKALDVAITDITKRFGKGSIMSLGQKDIPKVDVISTGCLSLDEALGVGGFPRGRVVEVFGPEAGGKTTLLLHVIAETQKAGGTAAFIDAEHALDLNLAKNIGVDVENLLFSQPEYGEQALEITESLIQSGAVDLIGIDSVAALTPRAEIEGEMGDPTMGAQARLMSQGLRKLTSIVSKTRTTLVFINQLRQKIGVMFGNPETTTGGNALKFYASVRLDVRRIQQLKEAGNVTGNRVRIKVVKNKIAPPFRQTEVDIIFGKGISVYSDLVDFAVGKDVITKSGSWYAYGTDRLGQGRDAVVELVTKDKKLFDEIKKKVKEIKP